MSLLKTLIAAAFKEREVVTKFISEMFLSPEKNKFEGAEIQISTVRGTEEYAIDVTPYSGGRPNKANIYSTKTYSPPAYNEPIYLTAEELDKVRPGRSQNDITSYAMDTADAIVARLLLVTSKVERAVELQAVNALVNGKIVLINGDEIDFKQKASHQYDTPVVWTSSVADPFNDFQVVGGRIRRDGVKELKDAIFGESALSKFLNNDNVKRAGELEMIKRIALTSPMASQEGANFHGQFSAGSYLINAWTYPQFVGIPKGFGLPNEGTKQPYIPTDKIICLPAAPDFQLYWAGVPTLSDRVSPELAALTGLPRMPAMQRGTIVPYFLLDQEQSAIKIGVQARPLSVPVGIDQFAIITVTT